VDNFRIEGADFAAVSRALNAVDKSLRKTMNEELRAAAKPVVDDMKASVLGLDSSAKSKGSASARREIHRSNQRKAETEAAFAKRLAKNPKAKRRTAESDSAYAARITKKVNKGGSGLRSTIARAIHVKIADTGWRIGVRVRVDGTKLPPGQKYLPRGLDSVKGWRHPVFGDKEAFVTQYGNPPGWFTSTAKAHRPFTRKRIEQVVEKYAKELAARIQRAA
jgi:hypothetical protein